MRSRIVTNSVRRVIMSSYNVIIISSDNVKFSRRIDCQHVLRVKKDLRNLNLDDLGFHGEKKLRKSKFMSIILHVMVQM